MKISRKLKIKKDLQTFRSLLGYVAFFLALCTIHFSLSTAVSAQRDYFTDEEIELIRDAQQIDQRVELLTHIIDRRFAVLKIDVGAGKISSNESDKIGVLPKGTRTELLADIKNILQKAIDDIDNLSERPDSMVIDPDAEKDKKKQKGFSDIFPKAVRTLAKSAERYKPALKTALDATKDEKEKGLLLNSIDMCDEIITSVTKLK